MKVKKIRPKEISKKKAKSEDLATKTNFKQEYVQK